jgi:glycosyltransferase involved in cell wall biosynthesis
MAVSAWRGRGPSAAEGAPGMTVTFIVAAHNEGQRIAEKLDNTLAIDYPALEILVASDCSTDDTDTIVSRYADRGVVPLRVGTRQGKEFAQLRAIERSKGEILVFSDVATRVAPDTVARIVAHFRDPTVGAVSSEDRFVGEDGEVSGEGLYLRYEMMLRRLESRAAGLVGLSGSLFAARREVCGQWDVHSPSDFNVAMSCAVSGLRAISAPEVVGYYRNLKDPTLEYRRKVRTVSRGMTGLVRHWRIMNPFSFGLFGWQVLSHKLMRWLVPVFLVALLAASFALREQHWWYRFALVGQAGFYAVGLAALMVPRLREAALPRIVFYFCQVNAAIVHAAIRVAMRKHMLAWQPSQR